MNNNKSDMRKQLNRLIDGLIDNIINTSSKRGRKYFYCVHFCSYKEILNKGYKKMTDMAKIWKEKAEYLILESRTDLRSGIGFHADIYERILLLENAAERVAAYNKEKNK